MYPLDQAQDDRHSMWNEIERLAQGKGSIDHLLHTHTERAEQLIVAMMKDEPLRDQAVNIPNLGYITNLPEGAIVEVPAVISAKGIQGQVIGKLPPIVALWVNRQIEVAEASVKAAVYLDKELMLEALLMDPMIDDIPSAKALLEDYLSANKNYFKILPQKGE
jgi:alpha-galactosidase